MTSSVVLPVCWRSLGVPAIEEIYNRALNGDYWIILAGMSFQAYLDNIEAKTGKTPNEFIELARERGYDQPDVKAGVIVNWLKEDFGLGRGHAMALVHVIKNGPQISEKHVGTDGSHRDDSSTLRLDGLENRASDV